MGLEVQVATGVGVIVVLAGLLGMLLEMSMFRN
jgi:hypothetical protein